MITTSQAWKEYSRDVGIFHIKAVIDNGTQMTLTDEDFMQGSVSITDSISGMSDFTVGAVITNSFNATLNNFSGKFNNYNLAGARISVQFGIIFDDETEEWIDRGIYTLEKPTSLGSTIKVVGYDDMDKLNRYYIGKDANNDDITFPIYANGLVMKLCEYCGVTYGSWGLAGGTIDEFEYDESTTCRQVLSWIMQSWGGYARINPQGTLDCKKFNANAWTIGDEVQGGVINPWGGAGTLSGGTMNPWSAVTNYDGGENGNIDFTLSKIKSLNVYVEDIAVTGVRAYAYNTVDEFQFDTVGTGGYVLAIQDNPLVTDNTLAVATRVYNATKDIKIRPFDASIVGDPSIEAGDIIALQDYLGNAHVSLITSLTYSVNSAERLECNAKTPEEADLETANPQTSVIKGATMAAYDYITAKKISADYISAGTITGAVEATNFTMTGGSINVVANDREVNKIELQYIDPDDDTGWRTEYSPSKIKTTYTGSDNYETRTDLVPDGVFLYTNGTEYAHINHVGITTEGHISVTREIVCQDQVYATGFVNTSLESKKKDIEPLDTALDKVLTTDIYKFRYKNENGKKHIGAVIGFCYNCCDEIITDDGEHVDLYSMISVLWKAVQEQQKQIDELTEEIKRIKEK